MTKQPKQKKCRVCTFPFVPRSTTQTVCSPVCALNLNKINKAKAYDKKTKELKASIKTRAEYEKEAQTAFNRYIRARDFFEPCISCGRHHSGQYHAGHFLSRGGHKELSYVTTNCHKQCAPCNNHLSGNAIEYRRHLIKKIGIAKVEWLEGPHEPLRASIEYLKRLRFIFNVKAKRMEKRNALKNSQ
jgi:hypothetical protein